MYIYKYILLLVSIQVDVNVLNIQRFPASVCNSCGLFLLKASFNIKTLYIKYIYIFKKYTEPYNAWHRSLV